MPDLGPLLVGSGVVALDWAAVRTGLAFSVLSKQCPARPVTIVDKA